MRHWLEVLLIEVSSAGRGLSGVGITCTKMEFRYWKNANEPGI